MNKLWIITAVDYGETCDGKARVLAICHSKDEAKAYIRNDMEEWADQRAGEGIEIDFDKMSATYDDTDNGCEWNIEEVEIPIPKANITAAEQVLVNNGIEADEASTVLQAIGYTLLDAELYEKED